MTYDSSCIDAGRIVCGNCGSNGSWPHEIMKHGSMNSHVILDPKTVQVEPIIERVYRTQNISDQIQLRISNLERRVSMGTNLDKMAYIPVDITREDSFANNEVGDTLRYIKESFGSAPLLKVYNEALDARSESDRRWKDYYEEEARAQSIFEAGED